MLIYSCKAIVRRSWVIGDFGAGVLHVYSRCTVSILVAVEQQRGARAASLLTLVRQPTRNAQIELLQQAERQQVRQGSVQEQRVQTRQGRPVDHARAAKQQED